MTTITYSSTELSNYDAWQVEIRAAGYNVGRLWKRSDERVMCYLYKGPNKYKVYVRDLLLRIRETSEPERPSKYCDHPTKKDTLCRNLAGKCQHHEEA